MFAYYVHHLNPVALPLFGNLQLRWYGLAYLSGFLAGFLLLRYLAKKQLWVLKPEKTADFIAAAALFGVFIGGRLGYILFYHIPREGWESLIKDPLLVVRVWEGGMASHGGILGLVIFTWFYAKKHKVSWTGLGDGLCVVAPIGLFFGRMANFINGELYGRVVHGISWAVKFPLALTDSHAPEALNFDAAAAAAVNADPSLLKSYEAMQSASDAGYGYARTQFFDNLLASNRHSEAVRDAIAPYLEPRHPSQIYEGMLEGLLLFSILWTVRILCPKAPNGLLTGLFFGIYAIFRIFGEQFRQPDAAWVVQGLVTQGQFLSCFMFLFSAAFLFYAWTQHRKAKNAL
ncbi:prolipoprotein diacylglyceryl transferase [Luteolibacter pohnpeiensis]|uniref:Phosphatidylglycerol--prolipoprotein diacylglyceryl transferase n=1 Tax=Luteolibacter pohnpeiensis TaxID=454153 RepID=A0A934SD24_9BACT|nr:prolipoprotein diacylglyceryl transferase [Luteolibacter pohnpeiensis]MBK1883644.1 prolipoprotein diacylglyceryl transferase [Luteolibacter pohnpeiensis]